MRDNHRLLQYFLFVLVSITFNFSALAVENPWFIELGYDLSEIDPPLELNSSVGFASSVFAGGTFPGDQITFNPSSGFETDEGLTFTLGYRFAGNWGAEVTYLDFGDFGSKSTFTFNGTSFIFQETQANIDGLNLSLFGEIPIGDQWSIRGKVGVFAYNSDSGHVTPNRFIAGLPCDESQAPDGCYNPFIGGEISPTIVPTQPVVRTASPIASSDGGQRINFSVGGSYRINKRYALSLEYSFFSDVSSIDIEMLELSLSYRF